MCNIRDDQMIQQLDPKDFSGFFQSLRDFVVFFARRQNPGWVVVGDDDRDRSGEDGSLENFTRMHH